MASLLEKFVDAEQWDAEDIAGRLGIILHVAFLFTGFQPYGAQPWSGYLLRKESRDTGAWLCLSRRYTAPDLAHRDGADAAVLKFSVQGRDYVTLRVFLTGDGDGVLEKENPYLEWLDLGIVRPLLSRSFASVEPWASRICKAFADGVCWSFLDELCRRNGLPLSGFESLPDDLKGAILAKLSDGKDLARVECVSSQLRSLVAEHDHLMWKTLYEALPAYQRRGRLRLFWFLPSADESSDEETLGVGSTWKDKFVEARRRPMFSWYFDSFDPVPKPMIHRRRLSSRYFDSFDPIVKPMIHRWCLLSQYFETFGPNPIIHKRGMLSWPFKFDSFDLLPTLYKRGMLSGYFDLFDPIPTINKRVLFSWPIEYIPFMPEEKKMVPKVDRSDGRNCRKLARNDYKKKWHGGGAIHSPSSRYRWKHR